MLIKVYNQEKEVFETIDSSKLDSKVHVHRNTLEAFTKEDIKSFGGKGE